jgi:diacylglycerol O-acyltransferase-1
VDIVHVCIKAWWNAESIGEYWTLWNMPVHHWMIRHVYIPIKSTTGNRYLGVLASFFVSAIFHEVMIAVPLHRIKGYAFFGMLAQVRLHPLTYCLVAAYQTSVWHAVQYIATSYDA